MPVAFNEFLWSLGVSMYNLVYAHISANSIAAVNINSNIEYIAFVIFIGIADATAILVGNRIGAGENQTAYRYARNSIFLAAIVAVLIGLGVITISGPIFSLFKVSPTVIDYAKSIVLVFGFTLWIRVSNMVLFVGVFRAGGDTRFAFLVDSMSVWFVGVPLAFLSAFVFHLPVYMVYLIVVAEELVKFAFCSFRMVSRKWIHDVTIISGV